MVAETSADATADSVKKHQLREFQQILTYLDLLSSLFKEIRQESSKTETSFYIYYFFS